MTGWPLLAAVVLGGVLASVDVARAQGPGAPPARPARQASPIDVTGNWVSYVTEDWRFRMITPPKGDYTRVPLTPEGRKVADGWNPAADQAAGEQCRSYGAAAIMRVPARFRISWQDDQTLRVDTDAGTQTRLLRFTAAAAAPRERTWQGQSTASWDAAARKLVVTTTQMRSGYLRRNGVPYSADAKVTEYFVVTPVGKDRALVVTTVVEDPRYLQRPFVVSSHFLTDKNPSRWSPEPCVATW